MHRRAAPRNGEAIEALYVRELVQQHDMRAIRAPALCINVEAGGRPQHAPRRGHRRVGGFQQRHAPGDSELASDVGARCAASIGFCNGVARLAMRRTPATLTITPNQEAERTREPDCRERRNAACCWCDPPALPRSCPEASRPCCRRISSAGGVVSAVTVALLRSRSRAAPAGSPPPGSARRFPCGRASTGDLRPACRRVRPHRATPTRRSSLTAHEHRQGDRRVPRW